MAKMTTLEKENQIAEMLEKLSKMATLEKNTIAKVGTLERQAMVKTLEKLTRL
jgi:hypothetical protein